MNRIEKLIEEQLITVYNRVSIDQGNSDLKKNQNEVSHVLFSMDIS